MFGKQKVKEGYEFVEKSFGGEYMGGHMLYPKKTDATVHLFAKHLDIQFGSSINTYQIPYETIANIHVRSTKNHKDSSINDTAVNWIAMEEEVKVYGNRL